MSWYDFKLVQLRLKTRKFARAQVLVFYSASVDSMTLFHGADFQVSWIEAEGGRWCLGRRRCLEECTEDRRWLYNSLKPLLITELYIKKSCFASLQDVPLSASLLWLTAQSPLPWSSLTRWTEYMRGSIQLDGIASRLATLPLLKARTCLILNTSSGMLATNRMFVDRNLCSSGSCSLAILPRTKWGEWNLAICVWSHADHLISHWSSKVERGGSPAAFGMLFQVKRVFCAVACPSCAHPYAYFKEIQTRSADEPATLFFKCAKCEFQWKEG